METDTQEEEVRKPKVAKVSRTTAKRELEDHPSTTSSL